ETSEDGVVESRRDAQNKFTLGPGDSLEGKLIYSGSVNVQGRAEGEFRVGGNFEVGAGASVKALIDGTNVTIRGDAEGTLTARDRNARRSDRGHRRCRCDRGRNSQSLCRRARGQCQRSGERRCGRFQEAGHRTERIRGG